MQYRRRRNDVSYHWFSYLRSTPAVSEQTDILAYGCAIDETMTEHATYHDAERIETGRPLVEQQ